MNNLPLQPLKWERIDREKLAGIYCEKTESYIFDAVSFCSTPVAEYVIRKDEQTGKYVVNYGGRTENEYHTLEEAKEWCEFTHYPSKMQPYVKPDSITDIANWFKAAKPEPSVNDVMTQYGCHLEEVCEGLEATGDYDEARELESLSEFYKSKKFGDDKPSVHGSIKILDALCDQIVTATGVAYMMGFDIEGALKEVIRSNNSKMVDGKFEYDDNGKIMKPASYSKPDLKPFVKQGE